MHAHSAAGLQAIKMAAPIHQQNFRPSNPNAMQTSQQGDTQRGGGFQDKPDGFIHSSFQRDIMKAREILTVGALIIPFSLLT